MSSCSSDVGLGSHDGGGNVREQPCCSQVAVKEEKTGRKKKYVVNQYQQKFVSSSSCSSFCFSQKNMEGYLLLELVYTYRHRYTDTHHCHGRTQRGTDDEERETESMTERNRDIQSKIITVKREDRVDNTERERDKNKVRCTRQLLSFNDRFEDLSPTECVTGPKSMHARVHTNTITI